MTHFQHISVTESQTLKENNPATHFFDIRDSQSFESGHIEGAHHIHQENIEHYLNNTPKDTPLIIVCYHGNSSQGAAQYFIEQGFNEVYSLDGGYEAWRLQEK